MQEVSIGRVTATPYPYLVLPYFLKKNPDLKLKAVDVENPVYTEVNAYPFARTDRGRELLKLTDGILTRMIEDGNSTDIPWELTKISALTPKTFGVWLRSRRANARRAESACRLKADPFRGYRRVHDRRCLDIGTLAMT